MTLKSVEVQGVLSHKHTSIELDPGVNVFIGETNYGKSALLKAVYWAVFNRPNQPKFLARDDAKEQRVALTTDSGDTVVRRKTKTKNEYYLNDSPFTGVGTDVPAEIQNTLALCDVNFKRQGDPLFFISRSPGERARYLNENVADLWLIDVFISEFNSEIRQAKKDEEHYKTQAEESEAKYEELNWVPKLRNRVIKLGKRQETLETQTGQISANRQAHTKAVQLAGAMPDKDKIKAHLAQIGQLQKTQHTLQQQEERLEALRADWGEAVGWRKQLDKTPRYTAKRKKKLNNLLKQAQKIDKEDDKLTELRSKLYKAQTLQSDLAEDQEEIKELRQQYQDEFPDICPWCGADWSEK